LVAVAVVEVRADHGMITVDSDCGTEPVVRLGVVRLQLRAPDPHVRIDRDGILRTRVVDDERDAIALERHARLERHAVGIERVEIAVRERLPPGGLDVRDATNPGASCCTRGSTRRGQPPYRDLLPR